jgi:hypothetical protein
MHAGVPLAATFSISRQSMPGQQARVRPASKSLLRCGVAAAPSCQFPDPVSIGPLPMLHEERAEPALPRPRPTPPTGQPSPLCRTWS